MNSNKNGFKRRIGIIFLFFSFTISPHAFSGLERIWQKGRTPLPWYATAIEACSADWLYTRNPPSAIDPEARFGSGSIDNPGPLESDYRFCWGTNAGTGDDYYTGSTLGYPCALILPGAQGYELCSMPQRDDPDKDDGYPCTKGAGNPCNVATGNKYQSETDFSSRDLSFVRSYNSHNLAELGLGKGWRSNQQKKLIVSGDSLVQVSGTGRGELWQKNNNVWQGEEDSNVTISQTATEFHLTRETGYIERYALDGHIKLEITPSGLQTTYYYNSQDRLSSVTNHYGHSLHFTYIDNRLASVVDSFGAIYRYEYDANNNLITIIYPDTTPGNDIDNPRRTYHYENANFPNHLTGITDANGDRFSTYSYDQFGNAITTEHSQTTNGVGQERFELDYR